MTIVQVLLKPEMDPGVVSPGGRGIKEIVRNIASSVVTGAMNVVTSGPAPTGPIQAVKSLNDASDQ